MRQLPEADAATLRETVGRLLTAVGDKGQCRGCGAEIWWLVHRNGKKVPYTAAGLNHFIDCPNAKDFKRPKE